MTVFSSVFPLASVRLLFSPPLSANEPLRLIMTIPSLILFSAKLGTCQPFHQRWGFVLDNAFTFTVIFVVVVVTIIIIIIVVVVIVVVIVIVINIFNINYYDYDYDYNYDWYLLQHHLVFRVLFKQPDGLQIQ